MASSAKLYYAALLIVMTAILIPIWLVNYPGMVDYPNHLARCYVIAHFYENPLWQQRFILIHNPIPNLAIDLIVPPLLRFFPLLLSGKLFLSLMAVLYVLGCSEVGRAVTGKPNWLALVCAFTFYNSQLIYGFVNYIFGLGVFLCAFAFWFRVRNNMTPMHFFLCCLWSVVAFLAHLSSIVILGVACATIASLDFLKDRKIRGLIVKLAFLACPVLLTWGFLKGTGRVGTIQWGTIGGKLVNLLAPVLSYNSAFDIGLLVVLLICAAAMLMRFKVHSIAVVSLVLFLLFLITPKVWFTAASVDARYVMPAYLLLILSFEPSWGPWQKTALAVALAAMAIHTAGIAANWLSISRRSEQVLAMEQNLPAGARICVVEPDFTPSRKFDRGFVHVIELWTVSKGADVSGLFALPGQQPLVFRQRPCVGEGPDRDKCFSNYDFVWTYDPDSSLQQDLLHIATPAASWEKVTLWRLTRNAASI